MPGKRNLARERAAHDAPGIQARIFSQLSELLPDHDRALIGRAQIIDHLHAFGISRRNGRRISWVMLLRGPRTLGFPVLRGFWHPKARSPAFTTEHAVAAWVLSQFTSESGCPFRICIPAVDAQEGNAPHESDASGKPGTIPVRPAA